MTGPARRRRTPAYAGTILVVEDDEMVASAWQQSLSRDHYVVHIARSVAEALREFDAHPTDVVVTDLLMPGGTGLDLLKELEARDPLVPVIIVTADQSVEAAAEAVREHAFDYLTKPVRATRLAETVRRAIDERRAHEIRAHEEERLREEHRQLSIRHQRTAMLLSVLYNRAVEGILVLDADGRLVDASDSFVALVGQPLYELLDIEITELFDRHPTEGDIGGRIRALAEAPPNQGHWRGEVTVRAARGRRLPAKMSLSVCETPPVEGAEEEQVRYIIALLYYETAYEELSRHLQQADRLANIGLLAGSAAHEIKNELGPLLGYLTMIERAGDEPVDPQMIQVMRDSVRRVHEHVEHILEPLRPRVRTRGAVVLRDQIEAILDMLRKAGMLRRLRIEVHGDEDVVVHADKNEIHQIALNLITNAVDALGQGRGARGLIEIHTRHENGFGVLEVRDDGEGIPDDLRARVFEPFFTTKGSAGTGLGLPVVQDVVRELGGRVAMDAAPERGTIVTAWIPRYQASS